MNEETLGVTNLVLDIKHVENLLEKLARVNQDGLQGF